MNDSRNNGSRSSHAWSEFVAFGEDGERLFVDNSTDISSSYPRTPRASNVGTHQVTAGMRQAALGWNRQKYQDDRTEVSSNPNPFPLPVSQLRGLGTDEKVYPSTLAQSSSPFRDSRRTGQQKTRKMTATVPRDSHLVQYQKWRDKFSKERYDDEDNNSHHRRTGKGETDPRNLFNAVEPIGVDESYAYGNVGEYFWRSSGHMNLRQEANFQDDVHEDLTEESFSDEIEELFPAVDTRHAEVPSNHKSHSFQDTQQIDPRDLKQRKLEKQNRRLQCKIAFLCIGLLVCFAAIGALAYFLWNTHQKVLSLDQRSRSENQIKSQITPLPIETTESTASPPTSSPTPFPSETTESPTNPPTDSPTPFPSETTESPTTESPTSPPTPSPTENLG